MKMKKWQYIALAVYAVAVIALLFVATTSTAGLENGVFGTAWSLMPPVLAIGLALITKEVYLSLFAGVFAGGILAAGSLARPMQAVEITFKTIVENLGDGWNVGILIFLVFLGTLVALINKAGGSRAYGTWAREQIKSRKHAQIMTFFLGELIFVDANYN